MNNEEQKFQDLVPLIEVLYESLNWMKSNGYENNEKTGRILGLHKDRVSSLRTTCKKILGIDVDESIRTKRQIFTWKQLAEQVNVLGARFNITHFHSNVVYLINTIEEIKELKKELYDFKNKKDFSEELDQLRRIILTINNNLEEQKKIHADAILNIKKETAKEFDRLVSPLQIAVKKIRDQSNNTTTEQKDYTDTILNIQKVIKKQHEILSLTTKDEILKEIGKLDNLIDIASKKVEEHRVLFSQNQISIKKPIKKISFSALEYERLKREAETRKIRDATIKSFLALLLFFSVLFYSLYQYTYTQPIKAEEKESIVCNDLRAKFKKNFSEVENIFLVNKNKLSLSRKRKELDSLHKEFLEKKECSDVHLIDDIYKYRLLISHSLDDVETFNFIYKKYMEESFKRKRSTERLARVMLEFRNIGNNGDDQDIAYLATVVSFISPQNKVYISTLSHPVDIQKLNSTYTRWVKEREKRYLSQSEILNIHIYYNEYFQNDWRRDTTRDFLAVLESKGYVGLKYKENIDTDDVRSPHIFWNGSITNKKRLEEINEIKKIAHPYVLREGDGGAFVKFNQGSEKAQKNKIVSKLFGNNPKLDVLIFY